MTKKKWILLIAILLIGAAVWFKTSQKKEKPSFRPVAVERGDIRTSVLATGVVQPQNRLQIKPPIAGRAEAILVVEGQSVKKGQVLALMSSSERAALLDAARAKGPEELAHWEELYRATPLIAPLAGVIISRAVEPGQTVGTADAVLVMSNRLIVKAQVDETDIGRIKVKQKVLITLDAYPDDVIPGTVDHIAYEAKTVNNVTIYDVDVVPSRVPEAMRSGMTANVTFTLEEKKDVLLLPTDAVQQDGDEAFVLVPGPEKKAPARRAVETGLSDGKNTEITSGAAEGDQVLVRKLSLPASKTSTSPLTPWGRSRGSGGGSGGGTGSRRRQ